MAVDYLQEYLGIDPNDYSAMEQGIAGVSPVGQSIIPRLGRTRTPIKPPTFVGGPPNLLPIRPIRPILRKEPTPDFGSQISGLEEQIAKLTEQMSLLETEKQKALEDQDIMRAELAQAQQDALAEQGEQFATERSALEQQIADLTAQVGQQPPAETPAVPDVDPIPGLEEQFPYVDLLSQEPSQEAKDAFTTSMETGEPVIAPDTIQSMIDNMSTATGEGGLPEGYSYTAPQNRAYTMVLPRPGFRYAYGPDGDRIEVPDNKPRIDRPLPPPPLPPREELIPPNRMPPKRDDQLFIDDRTVIDERMIDRGYGPGIMPPLPPRDIEKLIPPRRDERIRIDDRPIIDERIGRPVTIPGVSDFSTIPIIPGSGSGVPAIKEPSPIAPPAQKPIGRPPLRREDVVPLRPREELIAEGFIEPTIANTGTRGIIGKNPVVSSGIGGIGARPSMPKPPQRPFFGKMIDRQPRQPMSVGGVGGISGRRSMRPMMRAGGGAIGQAIADLQNRLR